MIVASRLEELASVEGPLALTIGVFDGMHRGHRAVTDLLRAEAGAESAFTLVVTLDPHPLEVLRPGDAPPLLTTPPERVHLLGRAGVDGVFVFPFRRETAALSPEEFLAAVTPARARLVVLVIGHDFRMGRGREAGFEELAKLGEARGFRVTRTPAMRGDGEAVSSTRIRTLLREGRVREAAELLGHAYLVEGEVVPGRGIGRTLDFPTANVDGKDARKLLPAPGVYAVRVEIAREGGVERPGVMNLGTRPTFGPGETALEVHLPGFTGDLVGERLRVALVERLRDEQRFEGPGALRAQIAQDVREALRILERPRVLSSEERG